MNYLKLYRDKKTEMRKHLSSKSLKNVINEIHAAPITSNLKMRTQTINGYIWKRNGYEEKIQRKFVDKKNPIAPEHAQKFYLYEHSIQHPQKIDQPFGHIVAYELPFFNNRGSGAVDLVGYDEKENIIHLVEMKNCAMGSKSSSSESLISAVLEIETYSKFVKHVISKESEKERLYEEFVKALKDKFGLDIEMEKIRKSRLQKNLLIPKSLYEYSMKQQKQEKEILSEIPSDINIYTFSLKNSNFDVSQRIVDVAKENEMIFNFEKI